MTHWTHASTTMVDSDELMAIADPALRWQALMVIVQSMGPRHSSAMVFEAYGQIFNAREFRLRARFGEKDPDNAEKS